MPFIGSIYVLWKPHPEERDRHWVIIQNPVPSNPPEPATLKKQNNIHLIITLNRKVCGFVCFVGKVRKITLSNLEHKHLPSQHGDRVKVPLADVRCILIRACRGPGSTGGVDRRHPGLGGLQRGSGGFWLGHCSGWLWLGSGCKQGCGGSCLSDDNLWRAYKYQTIMHFHT